MYGDNGTFLRLNKKSSDYLEKNSCKLCQQLMLFRLSNKSWKLCSWKINFFCVSFIKQYFRVRKTSCFVPKFKWKINDKNKIILIKNWTLECKFCINYFPNLISVRRMMFLMAWIGIPQG